MRHLTLTVRAPRDRYTATHCDEPRCGSTCEHAFGKQCAEEHLQHARATMQPWLPCIACILLRSICETVSLHGKQVGQALLRCTIMSSGRINEMLAPLVHRLARIRSTTVTCELQLQGRSYRPESGCIAALLAISSRRELARAWQRRRRTPARRQRHIIPLCYLGDVHFY